MIKKINFFALFCVSVFNIHAALVVSDQPVLVISGPLSGLERPEGISFTPSGDFMVISNTDGNTVTFYKSKDDVTSPYETIPSFVLGGPHLFEYPHDVDFSPSGDFMGVACRENNTVFIFKRSEDETIPFDENPHCIITGKQSKLNRPASISFSPTEDVIAIANRGQQGHVNFYKQFENTPGIYDETPHEEITGKEIVKRNLGGSHGISYTPDGQKVAVVHKKFFSVSRGKSALVFYKKNESTRKKTDYSPVFTEDFGCDCLHSISFHPSGNYLAITNEKFDVTIYEKTQGTDEFIATTSIAIDKKGKLEGPKGVAFSPDGKYLAVTTVYPMAILYEITEE